MAAPSQTPASPERLAELLDIKTFPPPADFSGLEPGPDLVEDLPKTRSGKIMHRLLGDPSVVATLQKTAADA